MEVKKKKICFVVSTLFTVQAFMENHIRQLSGTFDIFIVANLTEKDLDYLRTIPIKGFKHVRIERKINFLQDGKSVISLFRYFRKERFFVIHSVTPKAGLITSLAGKIAGIENVIHIFTGQVWATESGIMKKFLRSIDKLIAGLNTHILVDGYSQRDFLISERVVKKSNSLVLANGSISGVDTNKFRPDNECRSEIRGSLGITDDQVVFLFLGRLCREKGIEELLEAFSQLHQEHKNIYLLLVGPEEGNYTEKIKTKYENLVENKDFCFYGLTPSPARLLNAGDVFCLPSYREGFGMSIIEASSTGLPTIVSDAYGLRDSTVPGVTGLVCKAQDVQSLYIQMKFLIDHPDYRLKLGANGREYVYKYFHQTTVSEAWLNFYLKLV